MKLCQALAFGALSFFAVSPGASAQTATTLKTWVSSTGTNTGTCDVTAPCATFAYAYSQTAAGGEIEVKDSGRYGSLTIDHAINLISQGPAATIGVGAGGTGITVAAGSRDVVVIRGLTLGGFGLSNNIGIQITSGSNIAIEKCVIQGFTSGIYVDASSSPSARISVTDNLISSNASGINKQSNNALIFGLNRFVGNSSAITSNNQTIYSYGDNEALNNPVFSTNTTVNMVSKQ